MAPPIMNDPMDDLRTTVTPFDANTVGLVDYSDATGSLLVRGNAPLYVSADGEVYFAYDQLGAAMALRSNLPEAATPFDWSEYVLLDVNLTDNQGHRADLAFEAAAFGQSMSNPAFSLWPPYLMKDPSWAPTAIYGTTVKASKSCSPPGGLIYWPVQGCTADRPTYGVYIDEVSGFQFAALIDYLHQLLTSGRRRLIYFHCISGVNRTGAVNVAYFLRYGSYFYPEPSGRTPMTLRTAYTNAIAITPLQQPPAAGDRQLIKVYCDFCHTGSPDTASPLCTYQPRV